jgi:hypothetical protein
LGVIFGGKASGGETCAQGRTGVGGGAEAGEGGEVTAGKGHCPDMSAKDSPRVNPNMKKKASRQDASAVRDALLRRL